MTKRASYARPLFSILFLCGAAAILLEPARCAEITSQELIHDGSVNPPGFRLDIRLLRQPGEDAITVRVDGFRSRTTPQGHGASEPARAAEVAFSDNSGNFSMVRTLTFGDSSFYSFVVPYAALQLAEGDHLIWFQITIQKNGRTLSAVPTNAVGIHVGHQARRTMQRLRRLPEVREDETALKVFVAEEATDPYIKSFPGTGDALSHDLTEREAVATETHVSTVTIREEVATEIAGGFGRIPEQPGDEPACHEPHEPWESESQQELDVQSLKGPWTTFKEADPKDRRIVYFATNRAPETMDWPKKAARTSEPEESPFMETAPSRPEDKPEQRLSEQIRYGWCQVNIPVKRAKSDKSSIWRVFAAPDPTKDYTLENLQPLDKAEFRRQVRSGDLLLYVHGFRNEFSDAILRTAQLRYDLEFPGPAVAFCWPSDGALNEEVYTSTHALADVSVGDLAEVLGVLLSQQDDPSGRRIHIIAHSMGNRVVLGAIYRLSAQGLLGENAKALGEVVLAAPDVGLLTFHQQVPYAIAASQRTTLYFCERDVALGMSQRINYYEPAGRVPYLFTGLDSIDANVADTSFLSHSYYATSKQILADMKLMIQQDAAPDDRMPPLAAKLELFGRHYWSFQKGTVRAKEGGSSAKESQLPVAPKAAPGA